MFQMFLQNLTLAKLGHPFSLVVWGDRLFYSDWGTSRILAISKADGGLVGEVAEGDFHALDVYHQQTLYDVSVETFSTILRIQNSLLMK